MIIGSSQITITEVYDGDSFYRAWADSPDGQLNFSTEDSSRLYMGVYSGLEEPSHYSEYKWTRLRGDSAITATLSNDSHQIGTNSKGEEGNYTGAKTKLTIFKGAQDDTHNWRVDISLVPDGAIQGNYNSEDYTYTVNRLFQDEAQVVFKATPLTGDGAPIEKTFSLSKNKQGIEGQEAKNYHLLISDTVVKRNPLSGETIPKTITISGRSSKASGDIQDEVGYFRIYGEEESYESSDENRPTTLIYSSTQEEINLNQSLTSLDNTSSLQVFWYKDSQFKNLLDTQTIAFVSDGINGVSIVNVSEKYKRTTTLDQPVINSTWSDQPATPDKDYPYLWNYEIVHYSNGEDSQTTPVVLAMYAKSGTSITAIDEYYALSSTTTQPAESEFTPEIKITTPTKKYLWNKETITLTHDDGTSESKSHYAIIGVHGEKGEQGPRGLQGLQGEEGKQGIQGPKGSDGLHSYTHIAYASGSTGQGFNHSSFADATHIGMYVNNDGDSSGDWEDYEWTLIKGKDGSQGLRGPKGNDGLTPYFHTAWANNSTGTSEFSTTDSTNKLYIGTVTTFEPDDPIEPSVYSWTKIKGDKGDKGETGTGIQSQIIRYQNHSNGRTAPTGSWLESPAPEQGTYLWTRTVTTYTEGDPVTTYSVAYNALDGQTGDKGEDGTGISSSEIRYQQSSSGSTVPSGTWHKSIPDPEEGRYLWTRTIIKYTDNSSSTAYSTSYYATKGEKGDKGDTGEAGKDGSDGVSITSVDVEYAQNTSATNPPTSGWNTNAPDWKDGHYMWSQTKTTYSSGDPTYSKPICITGQKGDTGGTGNAGRGIKSITEQYYLSDSKTQLTGGSWTTTPPKWKEGKYIWTQSIIEWINPTDTTETTPVVDSVWEIINESTHEIQQLNSMVQDYKNQASLQVGMKVGYSGFNTLNAGSVYICGLDYNMSTGQMELANKPGTLYVNREGKYYEIPNQPLPTTGLPQDITAYIVWDNTLKRLFYIYYETKMTSTGVESSRWREITDNTVTFTDSHFILGEVET